MVCPAFKLSQANGKVSLLTLRQKYVIFKLFFILFEILYSFCKLKCYLLHFHRCWQKTQDSCLRKKKGKNNNHIISNSQSIGTFLCWLLTPHSHKTVQRECNACPCRGVVQKERGPEIGQSESFTVDSNHKHTFYYTDSRQACFLLWWKNAIVIFEGSSFYKHPYKDSLGKWQKVSLLTRSGKMKESHGKLYPW